MIGSDLISMIQQEAYDDWRFMIQYEYNCASYFSKHRYDVRQNISKSIFMLYDSVTIVRSFS